MTQEALKLALEALEANYLLVNGTETHGGLEQFLDGYYSGCFNTAPINKQTEEAITAIKEALAQEQEPVCEKDPQGCWNVRCQLGKKCKNTPPQRTWVGLTDEQLRTEFGKLYPNDIGILELAENNRDFAVEAIGARHHWAAFQAGARTAEAKLKENT